MAIVLSDASVAFYEIFKTGSTFIRDALTECDIPYEIMEPLSFMKKDLLPKKDYEDCGYYRHSPWWAYKYVQTKYCIVRHPISWYESVWKFFHDLKPHNVQLSYWQKLTITGEQAEDKKGESPVIENDFNQFIERIINEHPAIYTGMVEQFVGSDHSLLEVIKTETLNRDLHKILLDLGYTRRRISPILNMEKSFVSQDIDIEWNESNKQKILYLEQEIIKNYYPEKGALK